MFGLILAGEAVYTLPFHVARFFRPTVLEVFGLTNVVNSVGWVHQSNGRADPLSRSWNRIFARFIFEKENFAFAINPWIWVSKDKETSDNPDIDDYMGWGELRAAWRKNGHVVSAMARNQLESGFDRGALEIGWSFPLFDYPFLHGRCLDTRPGLMGGGAMEINTVPQIVATDRRGVTYSKIPKLSFPVDRQGQAVLVQDVTYYARTALYDAFLAWRNGGSMPSGVFDPEGAFTAKLSTRTPGFDQDGLPMEGVANTFNTKVFNDNTWGLVWKKGGQAPRGQFPQYFRHEDGKRVAIAPKDVPKSTGLHKARFVQAQPGAPFTSRTTPAWTEPGPARKPKTVVLIDGSRVTYAWYRFVDQPSLQQYDFDDTKKAQLQTMVEAIHRNWPIDRDYMPPPTTGELIKLDKALLVKPPRGLEIGYVPIVTRQESAR